MTNPPPPQPLPSFRESVDAIDDAHPLKVPFTWDRTYMFARFDRMETKIAFFVDYIDYLTQRIESLEARLAERPES